MAQPVTHQDTQPPAETRDRLTHDEQMQDAQKGCAPCALCGGHAIINDAGSGAGYFIRCSNSQIFKASEGCLVEQRRLGGWAYNVMDWWNRLHTAALTRRAGGDAIGQSDGDPDGWLAVKVNAEGGIVMPYGPLHAGPDRPADPRYRWAPFYLGEPK